MEELAKQVQHKATQYWKETGDCAMTVMPTSIVDFVIEFAEERCHFPSHFTQKMMEDILLKHKNSLAMACVDVLAKAGAEGEKSHSENGISRSYESTWITPGLLDNLPNYVKVL